LILICSYYSLLHEVEISKEARKNQKTKRKDESCVSENLITKLTSDADYF
jgi:hypothetical protein